MKNALKTTIVAAGLLLAAAPALAQTATTPLGTSTANGSTGGGTTNPGTPGVTSMTTGSTPATTTGVMPSFTTGTGPVANGTVGTPTAAGTTPGAGTTGQITVPGKPNANAAAPMNAAQFNAFVTGRFDANGDGIVSRQEWETAAATWFGGSSNRKTFADWDTNHDGRLDAAEMQAMLSASGIYRLYDTNGDGVIDASEAVRLPQR